MVDFFQEEMQKILSEISRKKITDSGHNYLLKNLSLRGQRRQNTDKTD